MVFKCKICGGNLNVQGNSKIITCEYCGTNQTLPKLENDKIANLYERANHFRRNNEYDKAEALYEMILNEDSNDAEAYWSLVLCKFGVEYVEDPKTHEYIPTCNRTQKTSIFSDEDYKQALKYASDEQRNLYEIDAEKINNIQKGILEISNKEEPFDIFICYKETDEEGKRTQDSVIAQELYYQLEKEGFKVFFARITLEDKIGESYEPYIFAALNSAKAMLVIGTKKEYFDATWVKNEWSRYLALIKKGEKKTLIPCFKEMDAYDLPEEFAYLQSQDMSKIGFEQDLIHGIKKIVSVETTKKQIKRPIVIAVIIAILVIATIFVSSLFKNKDNLEENKRTQQILRQDITTMSGYTFNTTVEDLKTELMKKIATTEYKDSIEARTIVMAEEYLGIGWFWDEEGIEVVGIEIYSDYTGYVTGISCVPAKYGSGDVAALAVPLNLYEEAKKILGSETEEWKELVNSETIEETIYDSFTGEEIRYGSFGVGMRKTLHINRTY